jgi:hypothetical protein
MKIQEIVVESTELEEGWKSKLGAAALAGAAAFGGGSSDVQAQNYQPTTQSQQAPAKWHNFLNDPNSTYGTIGMLTPYYKAGKLSKADSDLYNKMLRAFDQERQVNPNLNTDAINKYFSEKYSGSQQILNKYANTPNKDFRPFTSQAIQTLRTLDKWLQQAEQAEQAEQANRMINPKNSKYGDTIVVEPGSDNTAKSGSSTKNDDENIRGGAAGAQQYDRDSKLTNTLTDYVKSFKKDYPNLQAAAAKFGSSGLDKFQKSFDYFQKNQNTIKTMELESDYDDSLKELGSIIKDYKSYLNKSDYKQDQSPAASQSPKAPEAKQASSDTGWSAKTTGKATGITKNGDQYTGNWVDGLANGSGERTLVNKGYTGGLVKMGNKLDTEWKNGMPVDGAKVKVTRPDGTVFNGHIKRGSENPWGYMIVK